MELRTPPLRKGPHAAISSGLRQVDEVIRLWEDLKRWIVEAGRIDESKAEQWIQEVLMVMEPYVQMWDVWPAAAEDRSELLRHILMENAQLFPRCKLSFLSKEFNFELKPRE